MSGIKIEKMRKFGISEFSTKPTNFYNPDVIVPKKNWRNIMFNYGDFAIIRGKNIGVWSRN
jgi:hypothetical protein